MINDNLLYFYELAKNNELIYRANHSCFNGISCLVLFEQKNTIRVIGITSQGDWFLNTKYEFCLLNEESSYFKLVNLLEVSYIDIRDQIYMRFDQLLDNDNYRVENIFPFYNIIKFVFQYMPSTYWLELAYGWLDMLTLSQKKQLMPILKELTETKRLSQQLRHRIRKDLRTLYMH